jgi:acetyl-CoA decarbonylase/synthase complex subunit gamma
MALTGIQIFKLLPKTNCKECGVPTCLAFAMKLAAGQAELSACPYVSDEAKAQLSEASAPPIRTVEIGAGSAATKVGGETVLFRHEKTFFNPAGLAVLITDAESDEVVDGKLKRFKELSYDRVGLTLKGDLVAVKAVEGKADRVAELVKKVRADTEAGVIIWSDNPDVLKAGAAERKAAKVLLYGANKDNLDAVAAIAKENSSAVGIRVSGLDEAAELTEKLAKAEVKDVVIDTGAGNLKQSLDDQVAVRRLAIEKGFRPLGFPTIVPVCDMADDLARQTVMASVLIAKYTGIVILSDFTGENLFPLLLQRMNIYTDPQRPMKSEEGVYEFHNPGPDSPVLVTSNFSLTYFIVSGEIENSRVPAYLVVKDTDGLSILCGWAAGKFVGDIVGELIKKLKLGDKLSKKNVVIPGLTAVISGDLEEELGSEWTVNVGPRDAAHITAYLKEKFA